MTIRAELEPAEAEDGSDRPDEPVRQPPRRGLDAARRAGAVTSRALARLRLSWAGMAGALLFASAAFTPSLLPRDWGLQALVDGLSGGIGYALGVFLAWLVRGLTDWRPSPRARQRSWQVLALTGLLLLSAAHGWGQRWQSDIRLLMGQARPPAYEWLPILLLTLAVFAAVLLLARQLRHLLGLLTGKVTAPLARVVPRGLAQVLAVTLLTLAAVGINDDVVRPVLVNLVGNAFSSLNDGTSPEARRPAASERSGSPASLISWTTLGRMGRDFVGRGPSAAQLTAFSGRPALEPVRSYAGLDSAATTRARAELAVADLRRAGGFDRSVLAVATSTGTGWVDDAASDSLEYMFNGDTAIVSIQYSYLPSWVSFLLDREKAREAGRELFDAVYRVWSALPAADRPKLYVLGESLGVYGGQAAFGDLPDLLSKVDGVVWAGPPEADERHRELTDTRDPGSTAWLPVYDSGRHVRFAARPADLAVPDAPWEHPRVVYLQYASDPIVRWTPRLALVRPDWLRRPPAGDVSPGMRWIPFVTFWQVTADLPFARAVPDGHGHNYRQLYVDAWAAVAAPPGWTEADSARLRVVLELSSARQVPGW